MPKPIVGLIFGIASAISFALMAVSVHSVSSDLPPSELLFFRAFFATAFLSFILRSKILHLFNHNAFPVWRRSVFGAISAFCYYWTLGNTSVGTATVLVDLAPIFVMILSLFLFKERIQVTQGFGVIFVIFGTILLKWRSIDPPTMFVIWIGIGGAIIAAIAYVSLKQATHKFSSSEIVWAFSITMMLLSIIQSRHTWIEPRFEHWHNITALSVFGLLGQITLTKSYQNLRTSVASAIGLTSCLWGSEFDAIFNQIQLNTITISAYIIIIIGVYFAQKSFIKLNIKQKPYNIIEKITSNNRRTVL